ncbi:hypothetical protein [Paenibacillus prosopidis]|uniref:Uncharacterized protein n=1 Tax=Paenibacillus prosopidis TaxID=630520 RepID=A0A368VP39_9BACL|nr:hypothetical protein [Paenibacillus prosopidis]RCW41580.1 hypothetical protein DFP97_12216 [Paenibacillus prosopidis]
MNYSKAGVIFLVTSGVFYTLERISQWYVIAMIGNGNGINQGNAGWSGSHNVPLSENIFVVPFLLLGIILIIWGFVKDNKR